MNFSTIADIRNRGFSGFLSISALQKSKCSDVPNEPGVYLILRSGAALPKFLDASIGGHFKGNNPTVAARTLESRWLENTPVLYIGKAGPRTATLRSHLWQYLRFGQGQRVGHWGGRYIWQLRESCDLIVCWKITALDSPRMIEKALMNEFKQAHGKLPFANLSH